MLQTYSSQQGFAEDRVREPGLVQYFAVAKRRIFYFLVPFILVLGLGFLVVAIQRPIYLAEGKILVETQDIPIDLVRPTVTDTANQRIQVIQQRIMTRDNLLAIVSKFGLFATQRQWMSGSQLLDLMRERTKLKVMDLTLPTQQSNLTIAFTLSFEYENPEFAVRVANEFLTLILNEDARNRSNRASETTKFLQQEAKRLESVVASIEAQISEIRLRPRDPVHEIPEQVKTQLAALATLKADLIQKASVYSEGHPTVKALKKKIAALEKITADSPQTTQASQVDNGIEALKRQLVGAETSLEEANRKLAAARLGENLERNQQSERLKVIEQPILPQKPVKPDRLKLLAMVFALAGIVGVGTVMAAESFDKTIHSSQELVGVVDSQLIVSIPYISTSAEKLRKKSRIMLLVGLMTMVLLAVIAVALYLGMSVDLSSWVDRSWIDKLTRLSK